MVRLDKNIKTKGRRTDWRSRTKDTSSTATAVVLWRSLTANWSSSSRSFHIRGATNGLRALSRIFLKRSRATRFHLQIPTAISVNTQKKPAAFPRVKGSGGD